MRAFDKLVEAMSRPKPQPRPRIRYRVIGTIIFRNPHGYDQRLHVNNVNEVVYAYSPAQAEGIVAKRIAEKKKFRRYEYFKNQGHSIKEEPEPPPPPTRLPYKDDEQLEMNF